MPDEKPAPTREEVRDRTVKKLQILGNQRFALPPFHENFDRWLMNLREVISEFESNTAIKVDGRFREESSKAISEIELDLDNRRLKESSADEAIRNLIDTKKLLEVIEDEYVQKTKEVRRRRDQEVKHASNKVDALKAELDRTARMRTGIFRAISRRHRAEKEAEANQRLISARRELEVITQSYTAEQERLRGEYERRKQSILEQRRNYPGDPELLENESRTDGSLEARRATCETLVNAVNALLMRSQGRQDIR